MKTPRELQLALGRLLDRIKVINNWSYRSFMNASQTSNVTKSEAYRFYKALVEMKLIIFNKHRRRTEANFDVQIWHNEDLKLLLVKDIMEMYPDIQQQRGRVKGKHYPARPVVEPEVEEEVCAEINLLANFTPQELANELRSRGFVVTATREVVKVEEL